MSSISNNSQKDNNLIPLEIISGFSKKSSGDGKSMELFEENENEKPPLSKFLNQIM